jgi:glycerol-3-phosphate dehydrogenase
MRRDLGDLADKTFDLLILGGGITGAGIALDAALRGFRVALIDKADFASGTSSVSSKLVHGGLRYLEHGDFRLVYEALHERRTLIELAPYAVHPLRFIIPFYRGWRVPPWKWRVGLTLYDLLAGRSNLHRSRRLRQATLRAEFPGLHADGLDGGASYFDAQMDDARLCIEVLKTAAAQGTCLANYVEATALERDGSSIVGARVVDRLGGGELRIRARQVVNATGPWVDSVCKLAGDATGPYLRPTKGVHLVAPDRGLSAAFLLLHPADGRVFFVIPWLGKTLVGTTDTFDHDTPDGLKITAADIAYLFEGHNRYFSPPLDEGDVLGSFVGLRPLLHSRAGEPAAVSREARLIESPGGLLSIAGGKYTTYRCMAEQVTDAVAHRLGSRMKSRTRHFKLDGTPPEKWEAFEPRELLRLEAKYDLSPATARHLLHRYGRHAADVAACIDRDPELAKPVTPEEPDIRAELVYHREHEMAQTPADSLLRRTRLGLFHPRLMEAPQALRESAS